MKVKLTVLAGVMATVLGLAVLAGTLTSNAQAAPPTATVASVITPGQSGGVLNGTFAITGFTVEQGQLIANGVFTGTANGQAITSAASAPVAQQVPGGTCEILDLVLGPLHLDLLGLVVDLNQVNLNITAQQGSGNLLGNLLCAVAGLLDNNTGGGGLSGLLQGITNLLNQILAQL